MSKFHPKWEAKKTSERIIAKGKWWYQDEIEYSAQLIRETWNYTSKDLVELDKILEAPQCDYIDFSISDEGVRYFWQFSGPVGDRESPTFPTFFLAQEHITSYGYRYEIE